MLSEICLCSHKKIEKSLCTFLMSTKFSINPKLYCFTNYIIYIKNSQQVYYNILTIRLRIKIKIKIYIANEVINNCLENSSN